MALPQDPSTDPTHRRRYLVLRPLIPTMDAIGIMDDGAVDSRAPPLLHGGWASPTTMYFDLYDTNVSACWANGVSTSLVNSRREGEGHPL